MRKIGRLRVARYEFACATHRRPHLSRGPLLISLCLGKTTLMWRQR